MGFVFGLVVRFWIRGIYRDIYQVSYWDKLFLMLQDSQLEVLFWRDNFDCSGYLIWFFSFKVEVLIYSDVSGDGWGRFVVQFFDKVVRGSWFFVDCMKRFTFREVKVIRFVLEFYFEEVRGKEVFY